MPIQVHCPACSTGLLLPEHSTNEPVQCPVCSSRLRIVRADCIQIPFVDYYRRLGVDPEISQHELYRIIRKKVFDLHPDRNPGSADAEKALLDVLDAKKHIGEERDRRDYNKLYFAPVLKKWDEAIDVEEVIRSGPERTVGKRGSQDRQLDGIDHLKGQIEDIEEEANAELALVKHRFVIVGVIAGFIIGFVVGHVPGLIIFGLAGAIAGHYYGVRATGS